MPELDDHWIEYLRLQDQLDRNYRVDSLAWGLEAGLNRLLDLPHELRTRPCADRAVRSAGRKERHRGRLRRIHLVPDPVCSPVEEALDARFRLRAARKGLPPHGWALIRAVSDGFTYEELARTYGVTAGSLRVRVYRSHRSLRAFIEEQEQLEARSEVHVSGSHPMALAAG